MHINRREFIQKSTATGLGIYSAPSFSAESHWPSKPIRLVVPYAPGGSSEIVARSVAAEVATKIGQNVFVDNKPGAAGNIAMQEVSRSEDGHTIVLCHVGIMAVNPFIFPKLPFDPINDFLPISLLAKVPALFVVHPDISANNLTEFLALARAKPGDFNYGSAGNGSGGHLAFEYLKTASNTSLTHIPYKGSGPLLVDLMAGRVHAACIGASALMPYIKAGKLKAIAVSSTVRLPELPNVATVAEQGVKGYEFTQWYGLLAPAKWDKSNVAKLEKEAIHAIKNPVVIKKLTSEMAIPVGSTAEEFRSFITAERERWKPVIAKAQIKAE